MDTERRISMPIPTEIQNILHNLKESIIKDDKIDLKHYEGIIFSFLDDIKNSIDEIHPLIIIGHSEFWRLFGDSVFGAIIRNRRYFQSIYIFHFFDNIFRDWESKNNGFAIHKGDFYYYWSYTIHELGNPELSFLMMNEALDQDKKLPLDWQTLPAFNYITFGYKNLNNLYRRHTILYIQYIEDRILSYNQEYDRNIDFDFIKNKFFQKYIEAENLEPIISFSFSIVRLYSRMKIHSGYENILTFKYVFEPLYDLLTILDKLTQDIYPNKSQYSQRMGLLFGELIDDESIKTDSILSDNRKFFQDYKDLDDLAEKFLLLLSEDLFWESQQKKHKIAGLQKDLLLSYRLRNHLAHDLAMPRIYDKFPDIVQSVFNSFFYLLEKLNPKV